jgi:hypothetical protein
MFEILFTMLNLFVPTRVREAISQLCFLPQPKPDGFRMVALRERLHHVQIRDVRASRRFPKVA